MYLLVIVEVAIHIPRGAFRRSAPDDALGILRLAARGPGLDAQAPAAQGAGGVAAAVELDIAVQAQVDEIGRDFLDIRPFAGAVGDHQRDLVLAQQVDEGVAEEARMADLHGMAQARIAADGATTVVLQAFCGLPGTGARGLTVAGQQGEKIADALSVELHVRGKLPEERPQLVTQQQWPRGKEVGQRLVDVAQPSHMGDVARRLHRKDEAFRCFIAPLSVALGAGMTSGRWRKTRNFACHPALHHRGKQPMEATPMNSETEPGDVQAPPAPTEADDEEPEIDELLRTTQRAHKALLDLEDMGPAELHALRKQYQQLGEHDQAAPGNDAPAKDTLD
ncbi:hypothetical protein WR25_27075 [Diploscapter pachys]|uniref:Uncharacterized protein n=1 Tax=Diploscapter pachys TaxID=2018661 RepID=A0A2A2KGX6_9BILA|nr:hypothetical protein WR25_27075 [Diploscapter pachys]